MNVSRFRRQDHLGVAPTPAALWSPPRVSAPAEAATAPRKWAQAVGTCASSASVRIATRVSTWTSTVEVSSSPAPSSARAARPALASMSSAILASIVWAAMIRQAVTGSVCPIRWTRSMACVCSASVHDSSGSAVDSLNSNPFDVTFSNLVIGVARSIRSNDLFNVTVTAVDAAGNVFFSDAPANRILNEGTAWTSYSLSLPLPHPQPADTYDGSGDPLSPDDRSWGVVDDTCDLVITATVKHEGGISQTGLVEKTGIDRSTLADIVRRMIEKGLVQRQHVEVPAGRLDAEGREKDFILNREPYRKAGIVVAQLASFAIPSGVNYFVARTPQQSATYITNSALLLAVTTLEKMLLATDLHTEGRGRLKLLAVEEGRIQVSDMEAVDGTPVLDVKPVSSQRVTEDEVSPPVAEKLHDAKDAHRDQADDPGASEGQGVESGLMGHAERRAVHRVHRRRGRRCRAPRRPAAWARARGA